MATNSGIATAYAADQRLSDRIVAFLETETQAHMASGIVGETYGIAVAVNEIARRLHVPPQAVNGALMWLHGQKRIIGFRVIEEGGEHHHYVIALRPS
jgi:hypothetical protein